MQQNTIKTERQEDQNHINLRGIKIETWMEVDFGSLHLPKKISSIKCQSGFVKYIVSVLSDFLVNI